MNHDFRKTLDILQKLEETRRSDIEYTEKPDRIIASLKSHKSQSYTKLAQKISKIAALDEEIKKLKKELKEETRTDISDLFDAADEAKTRVVETLQFTFTLSKKPEETVSPKYKDIVEELTKHLTPELIKVLEVLKETMVTKTQKEPSLRLADLSGNKVDESYDTEEESSEDDERFNELTKKVKTVIEKWGKHYDHKLDELKKML